MLIWWYNVKDAIGEGERLGDALNKIEMFEL
jgi:hypothetical protein